MKIHTQYFVIIIFLLLAIQLHAQTDAGTQNTQARTTATNPIDQTDNQPNNQTDNQPNNFSQTQTPQTNQQLQTGTNQELSDTLTSSEQAPQDTLLFSVKSDIYTANKIVDNFFYKGSTIYQNVKAGTRYAVIASSDTVDTSVRLDINRISVYRDLYYGENAGIVFTPDKDEQIAITILSAGKLDGTMSAREEYRKRLNSTLNATKQNSDATGSTPKQFSPANTVSPDTTLSDMANAADDEHIGEYLIEFHEFYNEPESANIPYKKNNTLSNQDLVAQRIAKEFKVNLKQDTRLYIRMNSSEFDSLLEISDRFGRTTSSDDWGDVGTSLITLNVPANDDYYITASSLNGRREGMYELEIKTSNNELIEEIVGQVGDPSAGINSKKILNKYASTHKLPLTQGGYLTAEIFAIDNSIEVILASKDLNALYTEIVDEGSSKTIPLYAPEAEAYSLLVLSSQKTLSNYTIKLYR